MEPTQVKTQPQLSHSNLGTNDTRRGSYPNPTKGGTDIISSIVAGFASFLSDVAQATGLYKPRVQDRASADPKGVDILQLNSQITPPAAGNPDVPNDPELKQSFHSNDPTVRFIGVGELTKVNKGLPNSPKISQKPPHNQPTKELIRVGPLTFNRGGITKAQPTPPVSRLRQYLTDAQQGGGQTSGAGGGAGAGSGGGGGGSGHSGGSSGFGVRAGIGINKQ